MFECYGNLHSNLHRPWELTYMYICCNANVHCGMHEKTEDSSSCWGEKSLRCWNMFWISCAEKMPLAGLVFAVKRYGQTIINPIKLGVSQYLFVVLSLSHSSPFLSFFLSLSRSPYISIIYNIIINIYFYLGVFSILFFELAWGWGYGY